MIIPRGGDNHVAIDLIVQHIRTKLGQHDLCKIYPNVYVIQSTFQVSVNIACHFYFYFSTSNDVKFGEYPLTHSYFSHKNRQVTLMNLNKPLMS